MIVEYRDKTPGDEQRIFAFRNGWKASVIRNYVSYGHEQRLFELAVMDSEGRLSYDTPVTDDVEGFLTILGVVDKLRQIRSLPPATS